MLNRASLHMLHAPPTPVYIRFGDNLTGKTRTLYKAIRCVIGLFCMFWALVVQLVLFLLCIYSFYNVAYTRQLNDGKSMSYRSICGAAWRIGTMQYRLRLLYVNYKKLNGWQQFTFNVQFYTLNMASILEYAGYISTTPLHLFQALRADMDQFNAQAQLHSHFHHPENSIDDTGRAHNLSQTHSYSVFGEGILVLSWQQCRDFLQGKPYNEFANKTIDIEQWRQTSGYYVRKSDISVGWHTGKSQRDFSDLLPMYRNTSDPKIHHARQIIHTLLAHAEHNIHSLSTKAELQIARFIPRVTRMTDKRTVYKAMGELFFFLITGSQMTRAERLAYLDTIDVPAIFFPNWFNFMLAGHYLEEKNRSSYESLRGAFHRNLNCRAVQAAIGCGRNYNYTQDQVLLLLGVVFSIAATIVPSKLSVTVINRLFQYPQFVSTFRSDKAFRKCFIVECARLDKGVPIVTVLPNQQQLDTINQQFSNLSGGQQITNSDIPLHCSFVAANVDPAVFKDPLEFNPYRTDLGKVIAWNGVEEDINNPDPSKRPPRYCPGHDFSLDVIGYLVCYFLPAIVPNAASLSQTNTNQPSGEVIHNERFLLQVEDESLLYEQFLESWTDSHRKRYYDALDGHTKFALRLMHAAMKQQNIVPARGVDIPPAANVSADKLQIRYNAVGKFFANYDEDIPAGASTARRILRKILNHPLWPIVHLPTQFSNKQEAIAWRLSMFRDIASRNIIYGELDSDSSLVRLMMVGMACHHTKQIQVSESPHANQLLAANLNLRSDTLVYVNDMSGLCKYRVPKPYQCFGATVYLDVNFLPLAIYWCAQKQLITPSNRWWQYSKYVWRSSAFLYVTVVDHLMICHLTESNALAVSTRSQLANDHPLRVFLKPFTYHSVSINHQGTVSLFNEFGLVHRTWPFDYTELIKLCRDGVAKYKFTKMPDMLHHSMQHATRLQQQYKYPVGKNPSIPNNSKSVGIAENIDSAESNTGFSADWDRVYPYALDSSELWSVIYQYVVKFFEIEYNYAADQPNMNVPHDDAQLLDFVCELCKELNLESITTITQLIDVLTQLICSSVGYHEHVGAVADMLLDPSFIGSKLTEVDATSRSTSQYTTPMQSVQTYSQLLMIATVTGLQMPGLMEDWSHLLLHDHSQRHLNNYRTLKLNLTALSERIDKRNRAFRDWPFLSFQPRNLEISCSI